MRLLRRDDLLTEFIKVALYDAGVLHAQAQDPGSAQGAHTPPAPQAADGVFPSALPAH